MRMTCFQVFFEESGCGKLPPQLVISHLICRLCIFISSSPLQQQQIKSHNDTTQTCHNKTYLTMRKTHIRGAEKGHGLMCGMIWPNARSRVKRVPQSKRKHTLHTLSRRFFFSHFNCLIQIWQVVKIFWAQYNVDFPCCGNSLCCEWRWEK